MPVKQGDDKTRLYLYLSKIEGHLHQVEQLKRPISHTYIHHARVHSGNVCFMNIQAPLCFWIFDTLPQKLGHHMSPCFYDKHALY